MTKIVPDDADGDGGGDVAPEAMTAAFPQSKLDRHLQEAAMQGQLDQVKELLQSKANIEAKTGHLYYKLLYILPPATGT